MKNKEYYDLKQLVFEESNDIVRVYYQPKHAKEKIKICTLFKDWVMDWLEENHE